MMSYLTPISAHWNSIIDSGSLAEAFRRECLVRGAHTMLAGKPLRA